ncbi:hypothetical protein [Spirosoma foliorum]|uniref:Uncharacterized protein n=1 Tax=Spirosoma foliorum TaxID=2710596 RepID=A0A7G5GYD9_9BACT|nr:hypothetical protein [Spirosoma foliorum]QMW03881.1 hypothetical protein H3H32_02685 [Spirosoma foliorum]
MMRPLKTTTAASTFTPSFGWAAKLPPGRAPCHREGWQRKANNNAHNRFSDPREAIATFR